MALKVVILLLLIVSDKIVATLHMSGLFTPDNQDNDRTTTIQVTLVRPGRPTVRWGHAGSSQRHQYGVQISHVGLTTAATGSSVS